MTTGLKLLREYCDGKISRSMASAVIAAATSYGLSPDQELPNELLNALVKELSHDVKRRAEGFIPTSAGELAFTQKDYEQLTHRWKESG
jgi:hypothetical protein